MTEQMKITYSKTAVKNIKSLDSRVKERVREGIHKLPSGDIKKLKGFSDKYRLRVGDYRVIYERNEADIYIINVLPRGQAYNHL